MNIDYNEISKFDEAAQFWWETDGKYKSLHQINPLRLSYISKCSDGLTDKKILDVGCGGGILAESMAREGAQVTGLDTSIEQIKIARLHAIENDININYIHQTAENHAKYYAETYDIVTCMETLEHVPNPRSIVLECSKLVKPGGEVFFSTINRNIKSWLILIIGGEYVLKKIPQGTHDLKKFIRPAELLSWIDETSLYEKDIIGLCYNPFTDRFRFTSNININYMLHTHHDG